MEPRCSLSPARVSDEKPWQFRHSDPRGAPGHHPSLIPGSAPLGPVTQGLLPRLPSDSTATAPGVQESPGLWPRRHPPRAQLGRAAWPQCRFLFSLFSEPAFLLWISG